MIRRSWQHIVLGWTFLALIAVAQGPVGPELGGFPSGGPALGGGDPNCPNCNKNRASPNFAAFQGPVIPGVNDAVDHVLPPTATPAGLGEESVDECPTPIIKVRVKAPACAVVGKEMEYRFRVENCTPTDAHNVIVRTTLPASVKVIRTSPMVHAKEPDLQWNLGTLAGFGIHDLSVVVVPIGLADVKSCTRVQFEYGQCATTKVIALAPEGSEHGPGGPGIPGGPGSGGPGSPGFPGGPGGQGTREPPFDPNRVLDVRVFGPETAGVGESKRYQVTVINRGNQPLYKVGVTLMLDKGLVIDKQSEKFLGGGGLPPVWPDPLIAELPANGSKTLELDIHSTVEGSLCLSATASGDTDPKNYSPIKEAVAKVCTRFVRMGAGAGLTLEMFDIEDPILRDGKTSFPIEIKNQGRTPATNVRIRAKIPNLLELDQVFAAVKYRQGLDDKRDFWVDFDPIPTLAPGETQTLTISVKAKGQEGDARFHVEMTADQFDRGPGGLPRWIVEQESTTIVPDQETLLRVREASRHKRDRLRIDIP